MHRRYLETELRQWMIHSLLLPLALVLAACLGLRYAVGAADFANWPGNILTLCLASGLAVATALFATPLGREKVRGLITRYRSPIDP